jgi:hypothetical protein
MPYTIPAVREIVDPRSGRPASAMRAGPFSQRELVTASLLRVPRGDRDGSFGARVRPARERASM